MTARDELRDQLLQRGAHPANISFPDGWIQILAELNADLSDLDPGYGLIQVKVKFGGLRFYFTTQASLGVGTMMRDLARVAERSASRTCETCGNPGVARQGFWTLCDEHAEGREPVRGDD